MLVSSVEDLSDPTLGCLVQDSAADLDGSPPAYELSVTFLSVKRPTIDAEHSPSSGGRHFEEAKFKGSFDFLDVINRG